MSHCSNCTYLAQIQNQPTLPIRLWEAQTMDPEILEHKDKFCPKGDNSGNDNFKVTNKGLYRFCNRIWVPNSHTL